MYKSSLHLPIVIQLANNDLAHNNTPQPEHSVVVHAYQY